MNQDNFVHEFLDELNQGIMEAPRTVYTPTLIVGLGGSGIRALRMFKREMRKAQDKYHGVALLGVECDKNENMLFPELPRLDDTELCLLDPGPAVTSLIRAGNGEPQYSYINKYLPVDVPGLHQTVRRKIAGGIGAGQFRRAGKLYFGANVNNGAVIHNRLMSIRGNLGSLKERVKQSKQGYSVADSINIYIVSSFSGGTGAGMLIDFIAQTRQVFSGEEDRITVIGMLPGNTLNDLLTNPKEEKKAVQGNAYGVLQELKAISKGQVKQYKFDFDPATKIALNKNNRFVDATYLITDEVFANLGANRPLSKWLDVCEAVAYFLYALNGSGIGAVKESGAINSTSSSAFASFGVSAIKYPTDDIRRYAQILGLDDVLNIWKIKVDAKELESTFKNVIQTCKIEDYKSVGRIVANSSKNKSALIWGNQQQKERAVKTLNDRAFLNKCDSKRDSVDNVINDTQEDRNTTATEFMSKFSAEIEELSLKQISRSPKLAEKLFDQLEKHVNGLKKTIDSNQNKKSSQQKKLNMSLSKLKKQINFWDWKFDHNFRREYIDKTNRYILIELELANLRSLAQLMIEMMASIETRHLQIKQLMVNLDSIQGLNKERMAKWQTVHPDFVINIIDDNDIKKMCKNWKIGEQAVNKMGLPERLDYQRLIFAVLREIPEIIKGHLESLCVLDDIFKKNNLSMLRSLEISSPPLLPLSSNNMISDFTPVTYIAAYQAKKNEKKIKECLDSQAGAVQVIDHGDKHTLLCLFQIQGITDIDSWTGFSKCEQSFFSEKHNKPGKNDSRGWYCRTIDDEYGIEELRTDKKDKSGSFLYLGLGLLTKAITVSGSNFYSNIAQDVKYDYGYLVYDDNRSGIERELISRNIVQEAPPHSKTHHSENKLAKSMSSCIEYIRKDSTGELISTIEYIIDNLKRETGTEGVNEFISDFRDNYVGNKIARASEDNREMWRSISDALILYVDET